MRWGSLCGAGLWSGLTNSGAATLVVPQIGFILVVATLVDTFVVRAVVVPALMFCAVERNWWPGAVPQATIFDYAEELPGRQPDAKPGHAGPLETPDNQPAGAVTELPEM